MRISWLIVALVMSASWVGCTSESGPNDGGTPSVSKGAVEAPKEQPGPLQSIFLAQEPAGAKPLIEVKKEAKTGDEVVFVARVGGRKKPFVEQRATFIAVDPKLLTCDQACGTCPTPWDYCCETLDDIQRHAATVRVLGDDGKVIAKSIKAVQGLDPLKTVVIKGKIAMRDDAGMSFVVDATGIHVRP